jgi:hypothetical protein
MFAVDLRVRRLLLSNQWPPIAIQAIDFSHSSNIGRSKCL